MPPKAPGKGAEILVTDWCWGHLTKDDPTFLKFTPALQQKLRNSLPSRDDSFYGFQKAGASDEACSHHLTDTAGEFGGVALAVLSASSQQLTHGHPLEGPIQHQTWTGTVSSKDVLYQWIKPTTRRAVPAFRELPALSVPLEKARQEEKLCWGTITVQCKEAEERTPLQHLLADGSAEQLMRGIFFHPQKTGRQGPDTGRSDSEGQVMPLSKP